MLIPSCLTHKRNSPSIGHKDHRVKIPKCQCSHKVISTHLRKNINRIWWSHDREIWAVLTTNKTSFHWTKKKQTTHTLSRRTKKLLHWKTLLWSLPILHTAQGRQFQKTAKVLVVPLDQEKKHTHNVKKKKKAVTLKNSTPLSANSPGETISKTAKVGRLEEYPTILVLST